MKLTVDASIVVKWFVAEPLSEDARRLLSHRIELHAPDILLVEFANTIWKKVRLREIADPRPYWDELANLPEIVTLHPGEELVESAAQLATALDHPVYDCLYLACAEAAAAVLVTADRRFARKAAVSLSNVDVRCLGETGATDWIEATTTARPRDRTPWERS